MAYPVLYEINTRCWLRDLSEARGQPVTLADVPDSEFRQWQCLGFSFIWLMGVWTTGPRSRTQALQHEDLRRAYFAALPDWTEQDVGGSPYAIAAYEVDPQLGGQKGLAQFRRKLQAAGLKLVLDFVPNHLGLDHPWVKDRPALFVHLPNPGPDAFSQQTSSGTFNLAYGRDPYCSPWTDTVQLDYRRPDTRAAMLGLLQSVVELCDGVRCDMAMLVLKDVFARTWQCSICKEATGSSEFWADAILTVRQKHPGFQFLAEVYWGIEDQLQALGFDYTYDKELYDALVARDSVKAGRHLRGLTSNRLRASAHFLENHDEPRVASGLELSPHRAAALVILGLPGMRFLHEGQLSGFKRRLPVQLVRRCKEPPNPQVSQMYEQLLSSLQDSAVGQGTAELLVPGKAWEGNPTDQDFVLVQWTSLAGSFDLVVVNLSPHQAQCYAPVHLPAEPPDHWSVTDLLGPERYLRTTDDLRTRGMYLDVEGYATKIFHFARGQ